MDALLSHLLSPCHAVNLNFPCHQSTLCLPPRTTIILPCNIIAAVRTSSQLAAVPPDFLLFVYTLIHAPCINNRRRWSSGMTLVDPSALNKGVTKRRLPKGIVPMATVGTHQRSRVQSSFDAFLLPPVVFSLCSFQSTVFLSGIWPPVFDVFTSLKTQPLD